MSEYNQLLYDYRLIPLGKYNDNLTPDTWVAVLLHFGERTIRVVGRVRTATDLHRNSTIDIMVYPKRYHPVYPLHSMTKDSIGYHLPFTYNGTGWVCRGITLEGVFVGPYPLYYGDTPEHYAKSLYTDWQIFREAKGLTVTGGYYYFLSIVGNVRAGRIPLVSMQENTIGVIIRKVNQGIGEYGRIHMEHVYMVAYVKFEEVAEGYTYSKGFGPYPIICRLVDLIDDSPNTEYWGRYVKLNQEAQHIGAEQDLYPYRTTTIHAEYRDSDTLNPPALQLKKKLEEYSLYYYSPVPFIKYEWDTDIGQVVTEGHGISLELDPDVSAAYLATIAELRRVEEVDPNDIDKRDYIASFTYEEETYTTDDPSDLYPCYDSLGGGPPPGEEKHDPRAGADATDRLREALDVLAPWETKTDDREETGAKDSLPWIAKYKVPRSVIVVDSQGVREVLYHAVPEGYVRVDWLDLFGPKDYKPEEVPGYTPVDWDLITPPVQPEDVLTGQALADWYRAAIPQGVEPKEIEKVIITWEGKGTSTGGTILNTNIVTTVWYDKDGIAGTVTHDLNNTVEANDLLIMLKTINDI